eukprot:2763529-Amphidinium_carterae.2
MFLLRVGGAIALTPTQIVYIQYFAIAPQQMWLFSKMALLMLFGPYMLDAKPPGNMPWSMLCRTKLRSLPSYLVNLVNKFQQVWTQRNTMGGQCFPSKREKSARTLAKISFRRQGLSLCVKRVCVSETGAKCQCGVGRGEDVSSENFVKLSLVREVESGLALTTCTSSIGPLVLLGMNS